MQGNFWSNKKSDTTKLECDLYKDLYLTAVGIVIKLKMQKILLNKEKSNVLLHEPITYELDNRIYETNS